MQRSSVKKNTIFSIIKTASGIIYPLITFPYISRVLMAENVGKVNFGNSIVSYFSLIASLGVSTYAIRECSKARDNQEELDRTASQIFSINIVSTLISYLALVITLIVARPLDNYRELICIQSATILFTTLGADWINSAMEDFKYVAVRTIGMQLVSLALMLVFVRKPEDYTKYAVISVFALSGANVINIFYRRKFCKTRFTIHMDIRKHLPPILLMFSMILSQTIYTNSDTTILGLFRGDYEVGLYSTAVKIYHLVNTMIASVAWVVMPQLSSGFAKKDYQEVNRLLKYSLNFIIVLGLPCIVGVNSIALPIIDLLAGEGYYGSVIALHILTITLAFSLLGGWIGNMTMLPAGREKICLLSCGVSALVNIILNMILIPLFGLNSAATTTAIAECVGVCILSRYVDKNIKINNLMDMIKAPVVGSICIAIVAFIVRICIDSYPIVCIVTIFLSIMVYGIVLILMKNEFSMSFINPILNKIKKGR